MANSTVRLAASLADARSGGHVRIGTRVSTTKPAVISADSRTGDTVGRYSSRGIRDRMPKAVMRAAMSFGVVSRSSSGTAS